jgi:rhodanese-related sulfurtransferase
MRASRIPSSFNKLKDASPMSSSVDRTEKQRAIARLLNVSMAIAVVGFLGILIHKYSASNPGNPIIIPSAKISIKGVDLTKSPQTLLLAVAKGCEYCTDSARFYRRLVQGLANRTDLRIVAVFPDLPTEGQYYLNSLGVAVGESAQASLPSLGIRNVPSLVLLDRDGVVKEVWIGKLSPKAEVEVMKALALQDTRPTSDWVVNEEDLKRRLDNREYLVLVDLRDRASYALSHFPNARNIPYDELNARAATELPRTATIVLHSDDDAIADSSYSLLSRQGFSRVLILSNASGVQ